MAETIKDPAQAALAAATLTDVYTAPGGTQVVISSVVVCNRTTAPIRYRLAIAPGGAADDTKHYLAYDIPLEGRSSDVWTIGKTLGQGTKIRAYAAATGISVNVFRSEVTP